MKSRALKKTAIFFGATNEKHPAVGAAGCVGARSLPAPNI
jgi:hypothetical protein